MDKPSRPVLVKFATYRSRRGIYKARVGLNPNLRRPRWDERADASSSVDTDLTGTAGKLHEQSQGTRTQVLFLNVLVIANVFFFFPLCLHEFNLHVYTNIF